MGNHEGTGRYLGNSFPCHSLLSDTGRFHYGPAHIVMLDQYSPYITGTDQYDWLKDDPSSSNKTWKFILLHEAG